jgi:hypothetical protein
MLMSTGGTVIKIPVEEIKRLGRATQGVIVMRMRDGEEVSTLAPVVEQADLAVAVDEEPPTPAPLSRPRKRPRLRPRPSPTQTSSPSPREEISAGLTFTKPRASGSFPRERPSRFEKSVSMAVPRHVDLLER